MARKVQVQLTDDIDGSPADETLRYGVDGVTYEIDLSAAHADKFRSTLARFVLKSRRVGRGGVATPARGRRGGISPARSDREQNHAIREWAKSKGLDVNDRGRIPSSVVEQYQAEAGR